MWFKLHFRSQDVTFYCIPVVNVWCLRTWLKIGSWFRCILGNPGMPKLTVHLKLGIMIDISKVYVYWKHVNQLRGYRVCIEDCSVRGYMWLSYNSKAVPRPGWHRIRQYSIKLYLLHIISVSLEHMVISPFQIHLWPTDKQFSCWKMHVLVTSRNGLKHCLQSIGCAKYQNSANSIVQIWVYNSSIYLSNTYQWRHSDHYFCSCLVTQSNASELSHHWFRQ